MRVHEQAPEICALMASYHPDKLQDMVAEMQEWLKVRTPREVLMMTMQVMPPDPKPFIGLWAFGNFDKSEADRLWSRFLELGPTTGTIEQLRYEQLSPLLDGLCYAPGNKYLTGAHINKFDYETVKKVYDMWVPVSEKVMATGIVYEFYDYRKVASVPPDATAFIQRSLDTTVAVEFVWPDPSFTPIVRQKGDELRACISSSSTEAAQKTFGYTAYADIWGIENATDANARTLFGPQYPRLQEIKRKYDPDMVFNKWFCIRPAAC